MFMFLNNCIYHVCELLYYSMVFPVHWQPVTGMVPARCKQLLAPTCASDAAAAGAPSHHDPSHLVPALSGYRASHGDIHASHGCLLVPFTQAGKFQFRLQ
jgi:hypothetical protein